MMRPRPELLIGDDRGLILLAVVIGAVVGFALVGAYRVRKGTWPNSPIVGFVLIAQAAISAAVWVALGSTPSADSGRQFFLRYEIGWIIIVVATAIMIGSLWRSCRPLPRRNLALLIVLVGVIATQAVSSWISGISPLVGAYIPAVVIVVSLTLFSLPMDRAVDAVLLSLGAVCIVSLLTIPFDIEWSVLSNSRRIPAPFIDGRLKGVVAHPNVLAPLASLGLVLSVTYRRRNVRWLLAVMFGFTLWLTDGRTQIAATAAILGGMLVVSGLARVDRVWLRRGAFVVLASVALVGVLQLGGGSDSSDLQTLNGRTRLWEDAVEYWQSSPIYGVGSEAFDAFYRMQPGLGWAYGAHNQIMQTLAGEGTIGVVVLAAAMTTFVAIATTAEWRRRKQLIASGLVGLATMMVEAPLWLELYLPQWFLFLSVLIVLFAARPDDQPTSRPEPDSVSR